MKNAPFAGGRIDTILFDVIGTLVAEEGPWSEAAARVSAETGVSGPEDLHTRWAALLNDRMDSVISGDTPWAPHQQLVSESLTEAIVGLGGAPSAATSAIAALLDRQYPAWPDVTDATAALRRSHVVAGLSNGDLGALARLANTNAISWDIVLSTSAVRTFKPDPAAYQYAIDALAIDPARTLFVAAHPWDLRAAAAFGFRTAFVARPGAERPGTSDSFDLAVDDLDGLLPYLT